MLLLLLLNLASCLSLISPIKGDPVKGLTSCMNNEDCIGANRRCAHNKTELRGSCACKPGYVQKSRDSVSCVKNRVMQECESDYDCREGDVCIIVRAPYLADRLLMMNENGHDVHNQKICIGTWVIYADFEEPKTGGGLRSKFYPDDIFFKRGRRVPQQYLGFVEDMMLVLFLVCILVTLITVHRASCYRQIQDARRNTPLRHILPIPEDQPPPYSERLDSADGLNEVLSSTGADQPKRQSETPPPTYDEALYRNSVSLPQEGTDPAASQGDQHSLDSSLPSYNETRIRIFENLHPASPPSAAAPQTPAVSLPSGQDILVAAAINVSGDVTAAARDEQERLLKTGYEDTAKAAEAAQKTDDSAAAAVTHAAEDNAAVDATATAAAIQEPLVTINIPNSSGDGPMSSGDDYQADSTSAIST